MRKLFLPLKRIVALLIVFGMVAGLVPAPVLGGIGAAIVSASEPDDYLELNNGYIQVTVNDRTGGFGIRTVEGDKVNKSDNDRYLVFEYDGDNSSFTSFQVTKNGTTKEYIFGGKYPGSSGVTVTGSSSEIVATWSVDDLTIKQIITLQNSGSTEHGAVLLSYSVENSGEPAQVKCRILMDTALGYQDYAYYRVGSKDHEQEIALGENGYDKSFYAVNNQEDPTIVAYTINASVNNQECKPYQTIFAHWNNLASTVFDYTPDPDMTFTNFQNVKYLTSDSAYAQYFDLGELATGESASAATNYGVYSNEQMEEQDTMSVNVNAPDVLQFADGDETAYENGGRFTVKTHIRNISQKTYSDICIVVSKAGSISPLDHEGNPPAGYESGDYSMRIADIAPGEELDITWDFVAEPLEVGQYSRIHYKVYDVSSEATGNTGTLMLENLLGEGYSYILCPGSVDKMPKLKFTGISPDTIYTSGVRSINVTGENFSMLLDKSAYILELSRVDGMKINGQETFQIPADHFSVDDSINVISIVLNDEHPGKLPEGQYQITLNYLDPTQEDVTGNALRFHVSDDERYRNETYGFLAVVRDEDHNYSIETFFREEIYWSWLEGTGTDRSNVLLEFQGIFSSQYTEDGSKEYLGISNSKSHNVMTLNGSLDIRNGSCTITERDGSVTVDFDAELYTTGSNTFVYSGIAALTELEKGTQFALIPYSENGEREDMSGEPIALLWPSAGESFQNLMGLLFSFRFGELGVIAHEDAPSALGSQTRLVAFGAALDLSFLIPESVDNQYILDTAGKTKDALGSSWDAAEHNSIQFSADEIRALNKRASYREMTANTNATMEDVQNNRFADMTVDDTSGFNTAYVVIDDILFGGEYLGLNMEVALGIPPYIQNMPALECVLSVHTVGDWSFDVNGQCHFGSFILEAGLSILNHAGMPIVDSMRFSLGGFQPGFNIDGVGILWLQGAQGGIENIYDTIFLTEKIPPLKLIIGAQFSIMQIFNVYATMGLSLQGVELELTNGQFLEYTDPETEVVTVPQPITMDGSVKLDWYPEFYFHAAVNLAIAMAIRGSGYIVADQSGFYEFFIRGSVSVPSDIPFIGGYEVAGMGMGVNTQKLWGRINYLSAIEIGVTYYWGGDLDWNGQDATPTFPELLGDNAGAELMSIPVGYDVETGRTLYMALGTNMQISADGSQPLAHSSGDLLSSDVIHGRNHSMKLEKNGSGKILTIEWNAESADAARAAAARITIVNNANPAETIPVVIWTKNGGNANANLSYDENSGTACLSIAFGAADPVVFGKTWDITTVDSSQLVVYDVLPLPTVTIGQVEVSGNALSVELGGYRKEAFTRLTAVAEGKTDGQVYLLGGAEDPFSSGANRLDLIMPEQAVSDTYELRIICSDDDAQNYQEISAEFVYTNPNQPNMPTDVAAENAGNYMVAVTAAAQGAYDGFRFTVKDAEGKIVNGMSGILMNKDGTLAAYDENGCIKASGSETAKSFLIGGRFEQTTENADGEKELFVSGLSAGDYTIEVRTWKKVAGGTAVLVSKPVETAITVREPVNTQLLIQANAVNGIPALHQTMSSGDSAYEMAVFADSALNIRISSDAESFTGTWRIDGGSREDLRGEIHEATDQITLRVTDLADGQHRMTFRGVNQYGDSVSATYNFTVDTLAPRLMLDSPVNGSLFDYWTGELAITGLTDRDAVLTVIDRTTGQTLLENEALTPDEGGRFHSTVTLDRTILNHDLTIRMADALGNAAQQEISVMSNGLGSIEKLMICSGDVDVTNTKLTAGGNYSLSLMAKLKNPADAQDAGDLIVKIGQDGMTDWSLQVLEGDAQLQDTPDGVMITGSADAECLITARLLVSNAGAWSICAAYGYTGEQILPLDKLHLQIITVDQFYTGKPVTTEVQVLYRGNLLQEGVDYTIGSYANNVEPTTEATVQIHGMGAFTGSTIGQFSISYLPSHESWIAVSGTEGNNGWYVSDVALIPADGYEFVVDGESTELLLTAEGEQSAIFRVRRLLDGAMTDLITRTVRIDKTAPAGTIRMDQTAWSKFVEAVTFGKVKLESLTVTVEAEDNQQIRTVEYVIAETAYADIGELSAAELDWKTYSSLFKPSISENKNQIIYVRITDMAGNVEYLSSDGLHVDTTAPEVRVEITETTSSTASFRITSNEPGAYYYLVLTADDFAPTVEEVRQGASGMISGEPVELTVGGLKQNVRYVIYAVAEDTVFMLSDGTAAPNTSSVASSGTFTTDRLSLNDETAAVEITVADMLYTGEKVMPAVTVTRNGEILSEGTEYTVSYFENIEVSDEKPYVQVNGIGDYVGILTKHFSISYLPLDESWIAVSGTQGNNGWYVSDVSLIPANGYEFVVDGEAAQIVFSDEGEQTAAFRVRRLSDGAMTDLLTRSVSIDKTAPTGTITLDETGWSKFLEYITFGWYKVNDLSAAITASDNVSVEKIEYIITSQAITSATDLAAAKLDWQTYSEWNRPTIRENEDQIIYVRITDTAGNAGYLSTDGIHVDTIAPEVGIEITGFTSNSLRFTITSSEDGTYRYLVRKSSEPVPTVQELKAASSGSIRAGECAELSVSGLSPTVTYVVYALAEDTVVMLSSGEAAPNTSPVTASAPVTLSALTLSEGRTEITVEDMLYTGETVAPAVKVVYEGAELTEGIDYTVEYLNNVEVSDEALVRITGMGKYSGTLTATFSISYLPLDESWIAVSGIQGNNGWYVSDVSLTAAVGYAFAAENDSLFQWTDDGEHTATFRIRRLSDGAMTDLITKTVQIDKAAPSGSVTVDTIVWKELLNTISFGLFFNKTQEAEIIAEDSVSGVASIGYVVSTEAMELSDLKLQTWTVYTKPVELAADGKYVVYVKVTDNAGNISYLGTDGMVIDTVAPVVNGIEDGRTYEGEIVFTVVEDYIDFVSINGETVTGVQHMLRPMDQIQTIVVRDKAGNETVLNVYIVGCAGGESCPSLAFKDLDPEAWYHLSIDYVLRKGLMEGYGNKYFGPGDQMNRAMIVQVLYNLEGRPAVSAASCFTDVPADAWFTDAIIWAEEEGIVNGYGNGLYGPNDPVTREQMATIFYRYSGARGYARSEGAYDHFEDRDQVSEYAEAAMRWAVGNGLLMGMADGRLCPRCLTNRAEFATVIQRFCETIVK